MNIKKHIPNALTCGNILCGCMGLLVTSWYRLDYAFLFMVIGGLFDFLDGFVARLLKVSSPIGKDLDSLADMLTFGVLPGFIMFKMIGLSVLGFDIELAREVYSTLGIGTSTIAEFEKLGVTSYQLFLPFSAFLIPVFSAIRLAKFNNDSRQTDSFIGVPTPANAILISSLAFILISQIYWKHSFNYQLLYHPYILIGLTVIMSFLLVSELPLFALKFKNFGWADNKIRFLFLIISMILLILFQFIAIPFIIFLYILLAVINNLFNKKEQV